MSATLNAKALRDKRKLNLYRQWYKGLMDRLGGLPCASTNGKYLDGWYSPEAIIPDFLTHKEAARLRRDL